VPQARSHARAARSNSCAVGRHEWSGAHAARANDANSARDHATELREQTHPSGSRRNLPHKLDIRDMGRNEDEIRRPTAEHLIRDRNIAALRVPRLRQLHDRDATRQANAARSPEPVRIPRGARVDPLQAVQGSLANTGPGQGTHA
jgi:hypothetical protein